MKKRSKYHQVILDLELDVIAGWILSCLTWAWVCEEGYKWVSGENIASCQLYTKIHFLLFFFLGIRPDSFSQHVSSPGRPRDYILAKGKREKMTCTIMTLKIPQVCSSAHFLFLWLATNAWGPLGCHVFQITQPFLAWVPEWLCRAEPFSSPTVRSTQRVQWIRHKLLAH